jgi:carboxypeptidase T
VYFLWNLLENFADNDAEAAYLLANRQLYVIPCVNPDGYAYNEALRPTGGGLWRKNRSRNADGTFGVDLNRNYGTETFWNAPNGGSSTVPRADTYRGTAPFSELETQAVRDFCLRRNFRTAINYHSYSNLLIYPYSYTASETPDSTYFRALTAEITKSNLYSGGRDLETVGYSVRGASDDWMYAGILVGNQVRKIMAYTPEVGTPEDEFWASPDRIIPQGAENLTTNQMTAWSAAVNLRPVQTYTTENPQTGAARFAVEVQNIGIQDAQQSAMLALRPLAAGVQVLRPERTLRALRSTELVREVFDCAFDSTVRNGGYIPVEILIMQENTPRRDTVQLQVSRAERRQLFASADDATRWTLGRWGVVVNPVLGKSVLTDSPNGLYRGNDANYAQYAPPIDLTKARAATLEFQARWTVESNADLAVVQASADGGQSWQYLRTALMKPISSDAPSVVGFSGSFPQWTRQECSLNAFAGNTVLLRFGMISDVGAEFDGISVTDVAVRLYSDSTENSRFLTERADAPRILPNTVLQGEDVRIEFPVSANVGTNDETADVVMVNSVGQRVLALEGVRVSSDGVVLLRTVGIARGLYVVQIRLGSVVVRRQVMVV